VTAIEYLRPVIAHVFVKSEARGFLNDHLARTSHAPRLQRPTILARTPIHSKQAVVRANEAPSVIEAAYVMKGKVW
jgi:hypothetical protein